jgi:acylphosphatase
MSDLASLRATVYGRVQGVFFRAFVAQHADELGLTGFVRNLPWNVLEVVAEGEQGGLEGLVSYLEAGPPDARVKKVVTRWSDYTGKYSGFRIRI